jgi:hypothetical protein
MAASGLQALPSLFGISCPSASLCFAVDAVGDVVHSTSPTDAPTGWTVDNVTGTSLYGISCPNISLCVAVDYAGHVLTSSNPTGGPSAWSSAQVDGTTPLNAVSCPTTSLCVASDDAGNVLVSTNPSGGQSTWQTATIDSGTPIGAVDCPTVSLCVAADDAGNVFSSTNPAGGPGAWRSAVVDPENAFNAVTCPSASICLAVDDAGNVLSSTDPTGGPAAWSRASVDPANSLTAIACPTTGDCIAVDDAGNEFNSLNPTADATAWTGTSVSANTPSPFGGPGASPLYGIACPTAATCIAVDAWGDDFIGAPTPSNLSPPTVTGTATVGQTLTEQHGSWTDQPSSFTVGWERCDSSGGNCGLVDTSMTQTYTLTTADIGHTIRAIEAATNANGNGGPAESAPSTTVLPLPPLNTANPTITGTLAQGQTLTEQHGTWTNAPTSYSYQWQRCDPTGANCIAISGAAGQTFALTAADAGYTLRVQETAANAGGSSAPATSDATGVIPGTQPPSETTAQPSVTTAQPSVTTAQIKAALLSSITPSGRKAKIPAILKAAGFTLSIKALEAGHATVSWYLAPKNAKLTPTKRKTRPILVASGRTSCPGAGIRHLKVSLTIKGRKLLAKSKAIKLTATGSFTATGGPTAIATKTFVISR